MAYKSKICLMKGCNIEFIPINGNQKYCNNCKDIAKSIREKIQWRNKSRKINNYKEHEKVCLICKTEFKTYYSSKKYCGSEECDHKRKILKNRKADKIRSVVKKERTKLRKIELRKLKLLDIKEYFNIHGYEVIDDSNYISTHSGMIEVKCPKGHLWNTTFHGFKDNTSRCMTCYTENNYISKPEQIIRDYIESNINNINVVYNDRTVIGPKELDFYFPDNNLAIEVCGLYWHSEKIGTSRDYHYKKMIDCYAKGIRLITIFEDEIYNNFDIVMSRILQALYAVHERIYARKCKFEFITNKEANEFFSKYHIQGKTNSKKSCGLFYNGRLVSACSIGIITRKHTAKADVIELKRLCSLPGVSVIGGASKMFKYLKDYAKNEGYNKIRSYCDMRYANIFKTVYEVMGFDLMASTKYTPHYFKNGIRYRNFSLRKTPEERLTGKTEYELRVDQGYNRIWDCGHRTYELSL